MRQLPGNPPRDFVGFDQLHRSDLTNNLRKQRIG
jgi:hypothetical protein